MLKKTVLTAAAALALTGAAATVNTPEANAGYYRADHHYGCVTKYTQATVKYWNGCEWAYKIVWKPVRVCH